MIHVYHSIAYTILRSRGCDILRGRSGMMRRRAMISILFNFKLDKYVKSIFQQMKIPDLIYDSYNMTHIV